MILLLFTRNIFYSNCHKLHSYILVWKLLATPCRLCRRHKLDDYFVCVCFFCFTFFYSQIPVHTHTHTHIQNNDEITSSRTSMSEARPQNWIYGFLSLPVSCAHSSLCAVDLDFSFLFFFPHLLCRICAVSIRFMWCKVSTTTVQCNKQNKTQIKTTKRRRRSRRREGEKEESINCARSPLHIIFFF